jgi:hypothetical protein
MTKTVTIYLLDSEHEELRKKAEERSIKPHDLVTLLACRFLGREFWDQELFLIDHEIDTRTEGFTKELSPTVLQLMEILEERGPTSTPELMKATGRTSSVALWNTLDSHPEIFVKVQAPRGTKKKRGRQPTWWMTIGSKTQK